MKRRTTRLLLFAGLAAAGVVGVVTYHQIAPRRTPPGQPPLQSLTDPGVGEFRAAFNAPDTKDASTILAMFSPT